MTEIDATVTHGRLVNVPDDRDHASAGLFRMSKRTGWRFKGVALLGWGSVLAISLVPLFFSEVTIFNAGLVLIFFVGALGLQLLVNWAGQLSLAQGYMVGLPALVVLAVSQVGQVSPLYLLPLAVLVGAGTGVLVSLPAIRARGVVVALVTLMAGFAINAYFFQQSWLIGQSGSRVATVPSLGPFVFSSSRAFYPLLLAVVAVTLVFFWVLMHSKVGRGWLWIAADPKAASAFGIPVATYKIAAYGAAGAFGGLAGGLMAAWTQSLSPPAFPATLSFTYLLAVVLAGRGFAGGVLVSSVLLEGGPLFFSWASSGVNSVLLIAGPIGLILTIIYYKAGFNGAGRLMVDRLAGTASRRIVRERESQVNEGPR